MVYWVFGYGSLIFKPPPHAVEKQPGFVKGVVRRFAQSSNDHRGTPEKPGRVVTIIKSEDWDDLLRPNGEKETTANDYVWGFAYRIDPEKEDEVRAYMEHREKNGYTRHEVPFYSRSADQIQELIVVENAEIWIGTPDDPAFVGYEPLESLAHLIWESIGPSGPNKEYLYKLAESVRTLYPHVKDDYLFGLEHAVRAIDLRYS